MSRLMDSLSPRAIRILYSVFAILVLAIAVYNLLHILVWRVPSNDQCEWRMVFSDTAAVHLDWDVRKPHASMLGFERGDLVLAVNGISADSASDAIKNILRAAGGDTVRVLIDRDRRQRTIPLVRDPGWKELPFKLYDRPVETLVITNIVPGGVTEQAGAQEGDLLLRIDSVSTRYQLGAQNLLNRHHAGSIARFTIERDGELRTLNVRVLKAFNYMYFGLFLLGLGFFVVGYVVVMAKPEGRIQRRFGRYGILALFLFGMQSVAVGPVLDSYFKVYSMLSLALLSRIIAPPAFVMFFFHFPYHKRRVDRWWIITGLYGLCALAAFVLFNWSFHILEWRAALWMIRLADLLPMSLLFVGLLVFAHSYFHVGDRLQRKQLRPILYSTLIGVAVFIYMTVVSTTYPLAIYLQPYLLLPALLFIGIPPAFAYAIFKNRLMDVTVIVKRSIIYALITATIAAIYLMFVFGLGSVLGVMLGETDNTLLILVAFIVIALVFDPLKRRLQEWVDRIFYQERYNYQKALLEFSRELPRQIKMEEILSSMVSRISSTMHVERVAVGLCDDTHGCHVLSKNIPDRCCEFGHVDGGLLQALKDMRIPLSVALVNEDPRIVDPEDRQRIREAGIVLVVPMFLQDRLIGAIMVGSKMSGKVYSQEDIDLLSTVAGQAAIAIENARLHSSELEKQKITEQLQIAQRIQKSLLPRSSPELSQLDIAGVSIPAMTVGGDYYDYIHLPDDRLLVVVGDVSGKGISAALYMSKVQGILRFAASVCATPRDMLISTNRHLYEGMERNTFFTAVLALFDFREGTVTMCRAGHTQPLVGLNGDLHYMHMEGMGLGLEPGAVFDTSLQEVTWPMKPGGLVLLYSDGLTEAMDGGMNLFGEDRLFSLFRSVRHEDAEDIQRRILGEVALHRGAAEQNDDITMVVIRIKQKKVSE
ncbi:MAG: SpoIIE family protein phosphatase [Bacteroidia bacterium]|nr:SpoIIE family protein phosphatase [Bacteroidia bacterium]